MAYDVDNDPYLDGNTGTLRNLLGITTEQELEDAEARLTTLEIVHLTTDKGLYYEDVDLTSFKDIHKQLFKDIYDWAGEIRTVELTKGTTSFARVAYLEDNLRVLLNQLKNDKSLETTDLDEFTERLAHYYGELIVLHPYREGNGRAIRTFLTMIADGVGWYIAWDEMNAETNVQASIAAYQGNESPLRDMLKSILTPVDIFWGRDPYEFI